MKCLLHQCERQTFELTIYSQRLFKTDLKLSLKRKYKTFLKKVRQESHSKAHIQTQYKKKKKVNLAPN